MQQTASLQKKGPDHGNLENQHNLANVNMKMLKCQAPV